jgi:hypothetical protein
LEDDVTSTTTAPRRVRIGLLVVTAAVVVAALLMGVVIPAPGMEDGRVWALAFVGFPVAAVLLLWRRPGNVIGRLLGLVGLAGGGIFFVSWFAVTFVDHPASLVAEALVTGAGGSVLICSVVAILLLFPTGRPLAGVEWTFSAFLALAAAWTVVSSTRVGPMPNTGRDNPLGFHGLAWMVEVLEFVPFVFLVLSVWTLGRRHRRGGPLERVQLKWLFSSALLVLVAVTAAGLITVDASPPVVLAFGFVLVMGFWSVPATIVIAISRYRLYEIDRIWSRTVSYAIVTGVLAVAYVASIIALTAIVPGGSDIVIAASTLAAAALFSPVRRRARSLVDRWFDRSRFEADRVIAGFAASLRDELDLEAISGGLVQTAARTMRPSSVHLSVVPNPGVAPRSLESEPPY